MQAKDVDATWPPEPVGHWSKGPVGAVFMLDITRDGGDLQDMNG
jgi:hypothetical protein